MTRVRSDPKSDLLINLRFGALLYQMVTMTPLPMIFFQTARSMKIKSAVTDKPLQKLIVKCCKTEPSQRPSIDECIAELKHMLDKLSKQFTIVFKFEDDSSDEPDSTQGS